MRGISVYKYDSSWNLVLTYSSMRKARSTEKVRHATLLTHIITKRQLNGHYFALGTTYPSIRQSTWEGDNGFFDIDGWARMAY